MKKNELIQHVNAIEFRFWWYGGMASPLPRKRIASLLLRGFDADEIYRFGCDIYCGAA